MLGYILSPQAETDLDKIWKYSADTWSPTQAEKYIDEILGILNFLAEEQQAGTKIYFVREGYRKFPAGSHLIIYRIIINQIDVVRILHQKMDVLSNLMVSSA